MLIDTIEVVQNIQQAELPAVLKAIRHEIHGPDHVWCFRNGQGIGFVPLQTLAWLDPQVQFQLAIDAIDPLVVPAMPTDIAQVEEAQAEAPALLGPR